MFLLSPAESPFILAVAAAHHRERSLIPVSELLTESYWHVFLYTRTHTHSVVCESGYNICLFHHYPTPLLDKQ